MSDVIGGLALAVLGSAAFLLVGVLPGVLVADRLARPDRSIVARVMLAFVVSQGFLALVGLALAGAGLFSGLAAGGAMALLAIAGLPVLLRWMREAWPVVGQGAWAAIAAAPWIAILAVEGWPPADTLQWYYDGLGRQLTAAGGVPDAVAEWGLSLRWLPDYLVFNVASEAYLSILGFLPRADALAAWRVPVVVTGLLFLVAVLRLWVGRPVAVGGAIAIAGTTFFLAKFDAYKPEALGIVLGLAALWLTVAGVRHGRRTWVLAAGAALGLDLAVHAIAATVMGLMVAGFALAELLGRRGRRTPAIGWLFRAAALALLVSIVLGIGVQGRPLVASGAMNPAWEGGTDPTWTFFLRSTGNFDVPERPPPQRPLAGGVTTPWPGLRVTSAFGWWLLPVVGIGLLAAVYLGGRRSRIGTLGLASATALVGLGIAYFALAYDTHVPRWTGLVRFGQYLPLLMGLAVTFAVAGYVRAWSWLSEAHVHRRAWAAVAVAGLVWLGPVAWSRYAGEIRIPESGLAVLEEARSRAAGEVLVANALTTGTLELFAGVEAPFEGRQPLIEEPHVLAAANQLLLDGHEWFATPDDRTFLDRLGARWVLVVDDPATLGATATLGGSVAGVRSAGYLTEVAAGPGIALFEVSESVTRAAIVDSHEVSPDIVRPALTIGVGAILGVLLVVPVPALRRGRRRGDAGRPGDPG